MNRVKYAKIARFRSPVAALSLLAVVGCKEGVAALPYKLVATAGDRSIPMYPDEPTFLKVAGRAQSGGVSGAVGDVQRQFEAKQIDNQTPVEIISSDSNGAEVRITSGPMSGQIGFVAVQNVD
jgi:hypothetical protein